MDYGAILLDPIYTIQGVPVKLILADGDIPSVHLTAIDKTSGIDTGENTNVPTIKPAAAIRISELRDNGVALDQLPDSLLEMNGFVWTIFNFQPKPTPNGELDGEVFVFLSEKSELSSESESELLSELESES